MRSLIKITLAFLLLFISTNTFANQPRGSIYLDGKNSKTALILVHGRGKHPKWLVVDPLRKLVNKQLGYHTLSLQMPNENKDRKLYANDFPKAYAIIKEAIRFLKQEKGVNRIILMGHSMGARMTGSFVSQYPNQFTVGLIVAGCRNNGGKPLSCKKNLQDVNIPVLDIWGGNNKKDVVSAIERRQFVSARYQQVGISGANHKFQGYEKQFTQACVNWLKQRF